MLELTSVVTDSYIWKTTLGAIINDKHQSQRERLRSSFIIFRERAAQLASEIRRDLPDLTVHDITHLDGLWETASQIVGDKYQLTPTEGYVLGGAFLLHDLAMSIAATPGGYNAIKKDIRYQDLLFARCEKILGKPPTKIDLSSMEPENRKHVLFDFLRLVHAENSEKLAIASYTSSDQTPIFIIEDVELRQTFGSIIGRIAHSHWWSLEKVENQFSRPNGAPSWAPSEWTIDPLKIACILRAADAAHLDPTRAPIFVRAFSNIDSSSEPHWSFQAKLNKPYLRDDALVFTSSQSFQLSEATAWWMCLDALRVVDSELGKIDSMLAERTLTRFSARRVAGTDSPERLSTLVPTADWLPINATIHISDLPHIITSMGGAELYGNNPTIPLRELIQNASDAIRARRVYERRNDSFGEVIVSLVEVDNAYVLEVKDNGVGMSRRVLTECLLDFGKSLWNSTLVQEEFPGLLSSGFRATGKYGIGFFSVFMIADKVSIITRRPDAAATDTLILEFGSGISHRPILRPASRSEQLLDGGTSVRIHLKKSPYEADGLLHQKYENLTITLAAVCEQIAPAIDVNVRVIEKSENKQIIQANDWINIEGDALLARLKVLRIDNKYTSDEYNEFRKRASTILRLIRDTNGTVLGRACITMGYSGHSLDSPEYQGMLCVGGLEAASLTGICGVVVGKSIRASRDVAQPLVSPELLKSWAEEQATLIPQLYSSPDAQAACAQNIRICGGYTHQLPIAMLQKKWLSASEIEDMQWPDKIIILDEFKLKYELTHVENMKFEDNVLVTLNSGIPVIFQSRYGAVFSYETKAEIFKTLNTLGGAVIEAIAIAWEIAIDKVVSHNGDFNNERNVVIGHDGDKEISTTALIVHRP